MIRFYLVPTVTPETGPPGVIAPKYFGDGTVSASWSAMDYQSEAAMLVRADVTSEQHTTLAAQTDVLAVPTPITTLVSAVALSRVQSVLEGANLPAGWVTTSHSYRDVLRAVAKVMGLLQRYHGQWGRLFGSGITLSTTIGQLPQATRTRLRDAATSLGLDISGLTNQMTLRQALRHLADQLPAPIIGGETL